MRYPYLADKAFLKSIDLFPNKTQYVRLKVYNRNDLNPKDPPPTIEGYVTGGNLNINGTSAIRRTGSLSLVATDENYKITDINNIIAMNKIVDVEIGYENMTDQYPDYPTIWFPLGMYAMTNASITKSLQGINISVNLKDLMVLLNGELGGTFMSTVIHSPFYDCATNTQQYTKIKTLIEEVVKVYGGIPEKRINVLDIDENIKQIVRWTG
jgi:hypothetical protein